jgi:hypothetical protein
VPQIPINTASNPRRIETLNFVLNIGYTVTGYCIQLTLTWVFQPLVTQVGKSPQKSGRTSGVLRKLRMPSRLPEVWNSNSENHKQTFFSVSHYVAY